MRKLLFVFLLVGASACSAADLLAAWQAASEHDPAFQGDRASIRAGRQKEKEALALWLPNIGLQAGAGRISMKNETKGASFSAPALGSMSDANFTTDVRDGQETQWSVNARQPIFNAARSADSSQLAGQARLAELQFKENAQQLFLRVAGGYFDVLTAEEALKALEARKAAVQEALGFARESFNIGRALRPTCTRRRPLSTPLSRRSSPFVANSNSSVHCLPISSVSRRPGWRLWMKILRSKNLLPAPCRRSSNGG